MKSRNFIAWLFPLLLLAGCQTSNVSELRRFETSVRKELPFRIDTLRWCDGAETATYQFAHQDYLSALPDAEITMNDELTVTHAFDGEMTMEQTVDKVWRNVVVSKKNHRIICIDRYLRGGRTQGYIYVLQSQSKKYPTLGRYHWDVTDPRNIESAGVSLEHLRTLTLKKIKDNPTE